MGKITWRFADHEKDAEQLTALHHELERKIGRPLDLPDLSRPPVIATVVGETDGKITHGVFVEVEAEICALGGNPLPAKEAQGAADLLLPVLDYYKIRIARSFVPAQLLKGKRGRMGAVGRLLKGMKFVQESAEMSSWFRWLSSQEKN